MPRRFGLRDAADAFAADPLSFLAAALRRDAAASPVTAAVLGVVCTAYVLEVALALRYGAASTGAVVACTFVDHPAVAWAVAPFLHQTARHAAANAVVLALAAPVEARLGRRATLGLFLAAGYLPLFAAGVKLSLLTTSPHVAAYGASAFAYALLGCALPMALGDDGGASPRLWLVAVAGVTAILVVAFDLLTAVGAPLDANVGHLGGLLVGLAVGGCARRR